MRESNIVEYDKDKMVAFIKEYIKKRDPRDLGKKPKPEGNLEKTLTEIEILTNT